MPEINRISATTTVRAVICRICLTSIIASRFKQEPLNAGSSVNKIIDLVHLLVHWHWVKTKMMLVC